MGSAMLRSWIKEGVANDIYVIEPHELHENFDGIKLFKSAKALSEDSPSIDIFIMAVKPQIMSAACQSIKPLVNPDTLILSIAAGQTITSFEERFGAEQAIVRAMPNTPAAIGKGISVAVANIHVQDGQRHQADTLLKTTGKVEWLENESLLNAVTAVSGSGPAYVFYLIETLAKAGESAGLSSDLAMSLARQTVIGSAALAEDEKNLTAETLRQNVTSPGGTTEAALKILMKEDGLQELMNEAVQSAVERGKELA